MEVIELLASGQRTKPIVHPCLPLSKTENCLKVQNIGEKVFCCCLSLLFIKEKLPHNVSKKSFKDYTCEAHMYILFNFFLKTLIGLGD